MKHAPSFPLDRYLERVAETTRHIQSLTLITEADRDRALQETQHLLAMVAMYRHQLKNLAMQE